MTTPNLSVVGLQWGDEGKGKVIDFIADGFDAVARFNGGSNAGHTVVTGGKRYTFHLIPSGALKGKQLLVGAGVTLDPLILGEELALLPAEVRQRLLVDGRCSLVSPLEKEFDEFLEKLRGSGAIGTTKRGIGPSYAMRALRLSPRSSDLFGDFDFRSMSAFYKVIGIDPAGLLAWAEEARSLLKGMVGDVAAKVQQVEESGGSVLFEAAQGTLLDLLHGSYPYVTSAHTVTSYIPPSIGLAPSAAGKSLGVLKCYATRVGSGPFPTEIGGPLGDTLRSTGREFGATTGRPRRVGWLDLVALKYAIKLNGVDSLAITKLDVMSNVNEFKVCVAYRRNGSESDDFQSSLGHLAEVEPVYESPIVLRGANYERGLPLEGKRLVDYIEDRLGVPVSLVSHGEERSSTIEL